MRILIFSYQINPRPNPLVVSLSNHLLELALCPVPKPDFCVSFDRLRMSGEVAGWGDITTWISVDLWRWWEVAG